MFNASILLKLPGSITLDDRDALIGQLRETGWALPSERSILCKWEANTEWNLRGDVEEAIADIEANWPEVTFPSRETPLGHDNTNLAVFSVWGDDE